MPTHAEKRRLPHTSQQMFDLVADVEKYPEFLPWCVATRIRTREQNDGGETITARPEQDVDRTTAEGKASSIQFLHFPFTDEQVEKFRDPETTVTLAIGHKEYGHRADLPNAVREALAGDFD